MTRFFVSTPLDFEEITRKEMQEVWPLLLGKDAKPHGLPFPEMTVLEGGVEFEADPFIGLQFNFFLKTANRILVRLTTFKARDLPKFYQKFKALPWKEFLPHAHVNWEVAAQKSRLNNEKRLQESAEKALSEIFNDDLGPEPCASIYIRMDDDTCTISLDSTGEHLHKRGWMSLRGDAPLRETLAAAILKSFIGKSSDADLSQITLLDPMVGSGTFLCEARSLGDGQFAREFAFKKWKKAPKIFSSPSFAFNYSLPAENLFKEYVGFDISEKMVDVTAANFAEVEKQVQAVRKNSFKKAQVKFKVQDALKGEAFSGTLWMLLNPPYGERLPAAISGGVKGLADELCRRYKPQKLGILYPEREHISPAPEGYKLVKEIKINNGGLRCLFTILTRL